MTIEQSLQASRSAWARFYRTRSLVTLYAEQRELIKLVDRNPKKRDRFRAFREIIRCRMSGH